ncbi:UNVERIFIED_CONTAM: hypothetical protein GTU68_002435 [Idotea baltica]|nr:hypothetical protein [Idotea baltica]
MARILALDYGTVRTGIAVTDPLKMFAQGLTTVKTPDLFDFLKKYFSEEPVEKIVLGYPLGLNGEITEHQARVDKFITELKTKFPNIPIDTEDERYTSKMAMQTLIKSGVKRMKRRNKALIDEVSATIILQSYLGNI